MSICKYNNCRIKPRNNEYCYKHRSRQIDFKKTLIDISTKLPTVRYDNGDISDIGNEIGIAVGFVIENMTQEEISDFISGFRHGVSLTNGTH